MSVRLRWLLRHARRATALATPRTAASSRIAIAIAGAVAMLGQPATAVPNARADTPVSIAHQATPLEPLIEEALRHNLEIATAYAESEAARQRVAAARALEDPMLEAGIVNAPLPLSLRRDDMTMKMLGLSQRLPFPGKRELRHEVAAADAVSVAHAVDEIVNRVVRDVRVAYEELRLAEASQRLVTESLATLRQLVSIAEGRYAVGKAALSDSLQAQIQVVRMQQELLRLAQEESLRRSELRRMLGRHDADAVPISPTQAVLLDLPAAPAALQRAAQEQRPQLQALTALIDRSDRELALARREYYPDFEVRLGYGQRNSTLGGIPRDDLVTLTVAVNLPLWRKARLEPRVAEATAMRRQAEGLAEAKRLETRTALEGALASEQQQRESAALYRSTLRPQTDAAFDSALAAYRVGRVDFLTLLEARMRVFEAALGELGAIADHNKAIAEIDFLTGRVPDAAVREASQP